MLYNKKKKKKVKYVTRKTENTPSLARGVCLCQAALHCRRHNVNVDALPCPVRKERQHPATDSRLAQDGRPGRRLCKCHYHVAPPDHRSVVGTLEPGRCVLDFTRDERGETVGPRKVFLIMGTCITFPSSPLTYPSKVYLKNYFHYQTLRIIKCS